MIRGVLARARTVERRRILALVLLVVFVACMLALAAHAAFACHGHDGDAPGGDRDCSACAAWTTISSAPLLVFAIVLVAFAAQAPPRRSSRAAPVLSFEPRRMAAPRGPPAA